MNCYPPQNKRKYKLLHPYLGYSIALYESADGEPVFWFGDLPMTQIYFVLDDMGDNVLPVDLPFASPFEAYACIDMIIWLQTPAGKKVAGETGIWTYVVQNMCMSRNVGQMVAFLQELKSKIKTFDHDDEFGSTPKEFMEELSSDMQEFLMRIPGWRQIQNYTPNFK